MRYKNLLKNIIILFWILFGIMILFQYSLIKPNGVVKNVFLPHHLIFPQGWGFFSKDALEEEFTLYKYDDTQNIYTRLSLKNTDKATLYGLSRNGRLNMKREGAILSNFINSEFTTFKSKSLFNSNNTIKVNDSINIIDFKSNVNQIDLPKGKYLVMKRGLVPFHWSQIKQRDNMPVGILIFRILE